MSRERSGSEPIWGEDHRALSNDSVLVILPTYNERESLGEIVTRLHAVTPHADVLVIDDASPDGTGELADRLAAADGRVSVLHRPGKLGLGTAYLEGFTWAAARGYRWVVEMDADGSHLPELLPKLLAAARAGAGLVIGARWVTGGSVVGWPRHRRWISRTGTRVARALLHSRLHDITSGYRVFDSVWLARLSPEEVSAEGYGFQVEVAWGLERQGCPITEVPITFVERAHGRSKMTSGIVFEALWLVLRHGLSLRFGRQTRP